MDVRSDFEIYAIAEIAAMQHLLTRALAFQAIYVKNAGGEHDKYLADILDAVSRDIDLLRYPDIPEPQQEIVREKAKARAAEIVTAASAR